MKKFIVDTGDKKYKVEASTYDEAVSAVKAIRLKDEASPLQTVNALLEDERAAVDAYNVALENLKGKIPDESYTAIEAIRNDENRHIENLQAVVNGNVTEKNLEDSVKDAMNADALERYLQQKLNNSDIELVAEAYTAANKPVAAYGDGSKTTAANIEHFTKSIGYANVKQERVDGMWVCWVGVTE